LSTVEGIGSGVGRSASQSGGRWRGCSGQGGLLGSAKLGLGSRGSKNGRRSPTPGRCSQWQRTQRWALALGAFSWIKLLVTWPAQCSEVMHLGGGLQWLVGAPVAWGGFEVGLRRWQF
jgi:hypothetical protein